MSTGRFEASRDYQKIATANRQFYKDFAQLYDRTETCVTSPSLQHRLEASLDAIPSALGKRPQTMKVLDACGGSGNIALKLLRRGMEVTVCDITPELLEIFRAKCEAEKLPAKTVCSEIASYLSAEGPAFDLIVFSSALHHLQDIEMVLGLAFRRLAPGGALFTVFDPTLRSEHKLLTRALLQAEYYFFKVFSQTSDLPKAVMRRLRRMRAGSSADNKLDVEINESTAGLLAEFHVQKGINDRELVRQLEEIGFQIVWHKRIADCRFGLTRWLVRSLGDANAFELLMRKPASAAELTRAQTAP